MLQKRLLTGLLTTISLILTPLEPFSHAQSTCFMQGSNGQNLDLSHLCGGGSPDRSQSQGPKKTGTIRVPIKRRINGIPMLEVKFNDQQTFEMLLDTGASDTTISPKMAEAINLKIEGEVNLRTAGGVVAAGVGRVKSMQVGNMVKKNLEVIVTPTLDVGLLGQNFFGNHDITIRKNVVEFHVRQ